MDIRSIVKLRAFIEYHPSHSTPITSSAILQQSAQHLEEDRWPRTSLGEAIPTKLLLQLQAFHVGFHLALIPLQNQHYSALHAYCLTSWLLSFMYNHNSFP